MSSTTSKQDWTADKIKAETNSGEILTKPNQQQSIREILFRNTNGMHYDNYKTPYYEEQATFSSQSLNKIQDMEPTEKMQFLDNLRSETLALKNKIKSFEDEKAKAIADLKKAEEDFKKSEETPK